VIAAVNGRALGGDPFSAQEALEMRLLNYVVPEEQLMDKAFAREGPRAFKQKRKPNFIGE
jgi:enoyl-CoA hydratase/carnithine racemase